jgi:hypothetical protein
VSSRGRVDELYDRLISLAREVAAGRVNPLNIDLGEYIELLRRADLESYATELLSKDADALRGLVTILEAQYEVLKNMGLGLYIEPLLVKLRVRHLSREELADRLLRCWTPTIALQTIPEDLILAAYLRFQSLKPRARVRRRSVTAVEAGVGRVWVVPEDIRVKAEKLYSRLVDESGGRWIDYHGFISRCEDPVEAAYLISILATEGRVEVKFLSLEERYVIRPIKGRVKPRETYSLPIVVRCVGDEGGGEG